MRFKDIHDGITKKEGGPKQAMAASLKKLEGGYFDKYPFNREKLLPANFYVFEYVSPPGLNKVKKGQAFYYDYEPVILSLGQEKDTNAEVGLNINVFPLKLRYMLFDRLTRAFGNVIEQNMDKDYTEWVPLRLNENILRKLMPMRTNIAINKYDRKRMQRIRVVPWEDLGNLFFLATNKLLIGQGKNVNFLFSQIM